MSEMVVIGYPDEQTAEKAMQEVLRLQKDYMIELDQMAVVRMDADGKLHTQSPANLTAAGGASGAFWGLLFGTLFFVPFLGMAFGGAMGALLGKMAKVGIDQEFIERVRDSVKPGTSALFMVVRKATPDKVIEALRPYGGSVLRTSLSEDAEERLREAMRSEEPVGSARSGTGSGSM